MNILSIGGSDPSSGAGIQSDVKTFLLFDVHALTVITAITSQNTSSFGIVEPVSKRILKSQLEFVTSDFKIDGIKIGMVYNSQTIKTLQDKLKGIKIPIVVDPVIKSTTGGSLIKNSDMNDFRKYIIPLATIITPNIFEAEILSQTKINSKNTPKKIASIIQKMGAKNVVITGIKSKNNMIADFVLEKNREYVISGDRIAKTNHGSGCNYSAAIIFQLAKKKSIRESVSFARQFAYDSIKNAENIGKGIAITNIQEQDSVNTELRKAINKLIRNKKYLYKLIPECQTNFVYVKTEVQNQLKEILGISGRIVKTGKAGTRLAGNLRYGGSKHVATALINN